MTKFLIALLIMFSVTAGIASTPIKNITPASSSISKQEVYWIYTMRTRFWEDGTRITVFYQDFDSNAHILFCRDVLQVSASAFQNSIDVYVNVGNASFFRKVSNKTEMHKYVSRTPGAVGYVSEKYLLINGTRGVQKISIVD